MTAIVKNVRSTVRTRRNISDSEWEARVNLAACYRIFAHNGWDELIYNHLSVRVPDEPDRMLLNPHGLSFDEIRASDLLKLDLAGNLVDGPGEYEPNKAALLLHGGILEARPDINAVLHHHTMAGTAVASQEGGLLPLTVHALMNWDLVAYHDFEGIVLDPGEKERMNEALGSDKKILILRNHGIVTAGATIPEAFMLTYWLERACEIQIAAQAGGVPLRLLSEELQTRVPAQNKPGEAMDWEPGEREFQAVMRKLDRIDASYRE